MSIKLQLLVCIPPRATIRRYANPFPSRTGGTRVDLRRRSTRNRVVARHRRCFGLVSVHGHFANCFTQVVEISRYDRLRTSRRAARFVRAMCSSCKRRIGIEALLVIGPCKTRTRLSRGSSVVVHDAEIALDANDRKTERDLSVLSLLPTMNDVKSAEQEEVDEVVRSWIRNVFVPALVKALLEERKKSESK